MSSSLMEYFSKQNEKKVAVPSTPSLYGKVTSSVYHGGNSLLGFLRGLSVASYLPTRYTIFQPYKWPFASKSATAHIGIFDTWGKTPFVQWVLRLDKAHPGCEYPHMNINPKLTGVADKHIAIPGSLVDAGSTATTVITYAGYAVLTMAVCHDVFRLSSAMQQDYENDATVVGTRTINTGVKIAAFWTCGVAGAAVGSSVGYAIGGTVGGVVFGGVGAVPGAAVGSLLGKLAGGIAGGMYASTGAKAATDILHGKMV